jgi:DNA polymerase/3'-5' exonuclease PolX
MSTDQQSAAHHLQEALRHLAMAEAALLELWREDSAQLAGSISRARYLVVDVQVTLNGKTL